jgi:hemerythrin-like domain-containing protein
VAKKATRKKTATARAARKTTPARGAKKAATRTPARKTTKRKAAKKPAARKTAATKTAAKKNASRSAAARKRRTSPKPRPASRVATAAATVRGAIAGAVAGVTDKLGWSGSEPDAIDILEREHRRFEDLLEQGEATTERAKKGRVELLETLAAALNAHELMEENVLYPALESHPQAREVVLEGFAEHHVADLIVSELRATAPDDEQWGAKFKVLKENIEHHIQEEEGEMFRVARSIFSRDELRELATRMLELKPAAGGRR